ncbi:YagK/YfjJ domain-containing protein [Microvirgula aerodenitrificans]|uniref:YagK/YfjJ domain-containing protein n=1 Tax=Microvirgula aerodenitrificans TaxID=57480 RepID=UPI002F404BF3
MFTTSPDERAYGLLSNHRSTSSAPQTKWDVVPSNLTSLATYLNRLFDVYSRLLVIRIDLHFDYDYDAWWDITIAKKHLNDLFNNMRHNMLFKHKVGYVWKLEHGQSRGNHFHVVLFFDGHYVQRDEWLSHQICRYWADVITKGYGTFDNCNANKDRYTNPCTGLIDYHATAKRQCLLHALSYLAKEDDTIRQLHRPSESDRLRTFGHGSRPPLPASKMGRPRQRRQV